MYLCTLTLLVILVKYYYANRCFFTSRVLISIMLLLMHVLKCMHTNIYKPMYMICIHVCVFHTFCTHMFRYRYICKFHIIVIIVINVNIIYSLVIIILPHVHMQILICLHAFIYTQMDTHMVMWNESTRNKYTLNHKHTWIHQCVYPSKDHGWSEVRGSAIAWAWKTDLPTFM